MNLESIAAGLIVYSFQPYICEAGQVAFIFEERRVKQDELIICI